MMWYGVLGTKELLQRTYKNLEQKVQLEVMFVYSELRLSSLIDRQGSPPPIQLLPLFLI